MTASALPAALIRLATSTGFWGWPSCEFLCECELDDSAEMAESIDELRIGPEPSTREAAGPGIFFWDEARVDAPRGLEVTTGSETLLELSFVSREG